MPLWFALLLLLLFAAAAGAFRSAAGVAVLLGNWICCALYYRTTGDQYGYAFNAAADLTAGCLILYIPFKHRVDKLQILLGATYIFGLGSHAWYGQSAHDDAARYTYWYAMHYMAWSQLWLAAFWTGKNVVRLAGRADYPWRSVLVRRKMLGKAPR